MSIDPCPHCKGSAEVVGDDCCCRTKDREKNRYVGYVVRCKKCWAKGPWKPTESGAVKSWNRKKI